MLTNRQLKEKLKALGVKPAMGKRSAKPKPPPSFEPHKAVVIGGDAGTRSSGWAIRVIGRLVDFGEIKNLDHEQILKVLEAAEFFAQAGAAENDGKPLPIVLVLELPPPGRVTYDGRGSSAARGANQARGAWMQVWRSRGYTDWRCADAPLTTWRSKMLGPGWVGRPGNEIRDHEQLLAKAEAKRHDIAKEPGPDASPAVLISGWSSFAGEVGKRLVPRGRRGRRAA